MESRMALLTCSSGVGPQKKVFTDCIMYESCNRGS